MLAPGRAAERRVVLRFWQVFWAIAHKELTQFWRNKRTLRMLLLMQCFDTAVFGVMDFTVRELPTVLVDEDRTEESRELVQRIAATKTFDIEYATSSTEQARGHIRAGRAKVAVVIPPDYGRTRAAGRPSQILVLVDGSNAATTDATTASIDGIAARMNFEAQREVVGPVRRIDLHTVLLFNPQARTANYMLPGLFAIMLADWYILFGMLALSGERDGGNLERLLMTPMSYSGLVAGKLAPWCAIGVLNGLISLLVMRFGLGVPLRGDVVLLVTAMGLYLLTCVAIGLFFGASGQKFGEIWWSYQSFAAFWLSGYVFPRSSLPKVLLVVSSVLPQTHFIEIMHGILLRGASATELAPRLLYLVVAPLLVMFAAARRFARSVNE
jgi:ABC-2 type transport system permease protein